ncbi:MAG: hypothetical protein IT246_09345 [Bacteroidia bacterium]|nr:hypothetical protein [Bacteroidia bacterium]
MAIKTFNPYPLIGTQLTAGMDAVAASLSPTSTVDEFVNVIYNLVQPLYYPPVPAPPQLEVEIKSVIYNIINAYSSKVINTLPWTAQQQNFIQMMLGLNTTNNTPINSLDIWLSDIQDNISDANQSIDDQTPLLLAIKCGISVNSYWSSKVETPGEWSRFFQPRAASNYANIPLWVVACMEGALIGANASQKGLIAPTTDITSVNIISSLIGAVTIGAGKIIFKWIPEIIPSNLISNHNGILLGGFSDAIDWGGIDGQGGIGAKANKCINYNCQNSCTNSTCDTVNKCTAK